MPDPDTTPPLADDDTDTRLQMLATKLVEFANKVDEPTSKYNEMVDRVRGDEKYLPPAYFDVSNFKSGENYEITFTQSEADGPYITTLPEWDAYYTALHHRSVLAQINAIFLDDGNVIAGFLMTKTESTGAPGYYYPRKRPVSGISIELKPEEVEPYLEGGLLLEFQNHARYILDQPISTGYSAGQNLAVGAPLPTQDLSDVPLQSHYESMKASAKMFDITSKNPVDQIDVIFSPFQGEEPSSDD